MYTLAMAKKMSQLRQKPFQLQEEVSQGASLEIEPSDTGWSAEAIAEWEAEMNQFFGDDQQGVADRLD